MSDIARTRRPFAEDALLTIHLKGNARLPMLTRPVRLDALPDDCRIDPPVGTGCDVHYVTRGRIDIQRADGVLTTASPGSLVIRHSPCGLALRITAGTGLFHLHFQFDEAEVTCSDATSDDATALPTLRLPATTSFRGHAARAMVASFALIREAYDAPDPVERLTASAMFLQMLVQVSRQARWAPSSVDASPLDSNALRSGVTLRPALEFIENTYGRPISAADVAAKLRVTPEYLSRLFRKQLRRSIGDVLAERRMEAARHLLGGSDLSVKEVAAACGFRDPLYFSRFFRQREGVVPSQYVARHLASGCTSTDAV